MSYNNIPIVTESELMAYGAHIENLYSFTEEEEKQFEAEGDDLGIDDIDADGEYEGIDDLDAEGEDELSFNSADGELYEHYGLGSWIKKKAKGLKTDMKNIKKGVTKVANKVTQPARFIAQKTKQATKFVKKRYEGEVRAGKKRWKQDQEIKKLINPNLAEKIAHTAAIPLMAIPRIAAIGLIKVLNFAYIGDKLKAVVNENNVEKKKGGTSRRYRDLMKAWYRMGGSPAALEQAINGSVSKVKIVAANGEYSAMGTGEMIALGGSVVAILGTSIGIAMDVKKSNQESKDRKKQEGDNANMVKLNQLNDARKARAKRLGFDVEPLNALPDGYDSKDMEKHLTEEALGAPVPPPRQEEEQQEPQGEQEQPETEQQQEQASGKDAIFYGVDGETTEQKIKKLGVHPITGKENTPIITAIANAKVKAEIVKTKVEAKKEQKAADSKAIIAKVELAKVNESVTDKKWFWPTVIGLPLAIGLGIMIYKNYHKK